MNIQHLSPRGRTKTVFVDNFFCARKDGTLSVEVVPHLGLMTLAAVLENAGQAVEILDPKLLFARGEFGSPDERFIRACAEDLLERRADVIGFTAYGLSLPFVVRVAAEIKCSKPLQKIVLGGPHATIMGRQILDAFPYFDAIATYEAESIILPLVAALATGGELSGISNLLYQRNGEIVSTTRDGGLPGMDDLPDPALHLYPIEELQLAELSIEAGRGCPFLCTFCSTASFFQRRYRMKSNARMIAEMETARGRYGVRMFNLNHDLFGLVKPKLREFCELAQGRGFEWKCSMRPDTLDETLLDALAGAGCRHIYFGVETGSPELQRSIQKNLRLERTQHVVAATLQRNIHCTTSFIVGFPEETPHEQDQTLDFLGQLLRLDPQHVHPQLHILSPEPGSVLAERNLGIYFDGVGPETGELLDEALISAQPEIFSVFYHFVGKTPRWRTVLASAFVTHIMPVLGYPLTTHIFATFFDGSLAQMFNAIIEDSPPCQLDFETTLRKLWDGVESLARRLSKRAPYLEDLIRLSRILALRKTVQDPLSDVVWLTRFDQDVTALAQAIVRNPEAIPRFQLNGDARWCVIQCKSEEEALIGEIPSWLGSSLSQERWPAESGNGLEQAMRELEVSCVEV